MNINEDIIKIAVKNAQAAREKAVTFATKVGATIITKDLELFSGFNIEAYGYKFELHAEEMATVMAMADGYRGTDFDTLVVVFQSAWMPGTESYPGCPYCWAFLKEFTHPNLNLVLADKDGNILLITTLQAQFTTDLNKVYPSEEYKKAKPKQGTEPRLVRDLHPST